MRISLVLCLAMFFMSSSSSYGQTTITPPTLRPNTQPTTSPYLFLSGRGRNNQALNYYRQVRPQQQFLANSQKQSRAINTLGQDVRSLQQQTIIGERPPIGSTGHVATFFYYGSYFGNSNNPSQFGGR